MEEEEEDISLGGIAILGSDDLRVEKSLGELTELVRSELGGEEEMEQWGFDWAWREEAQAHQEREGKCECVSWQLWVMRVGDECEKGGKLINRINWIFKTCF